MLEDDIIIADSWLVKTTHALRHIESKSTAPSDPYFNWLYFRLFWTETSMRWRESDFWFRRMDLAISIGACSTMLLLLVLKRWVALVSLITVPAFIILCFMVGKYSLFPLRGVFSMNKYGCCTQALVFPRGQVLELTKWFEGRVKVSTDVMIDDYADERRLE
jgi:hypothetical protein